MEFIKQPMMKNLSLNLLLLAGIERASLQSSSQRSSGKNIEWGNLKETLTVHSVVMN